MSSQHIQYSVKYYDDTHEFRHTIVPSDIAETMPRGRLMSEKEWRGIGVPMSRGWQHYAIHKPEPHVLLFRRPKGTPLKASSPKDSDGVQSMETGDDDGDIVLPNGDDNHVNTMDTGDD